MKRVLIFTYYWPPSGGAGVQRWLKFAKYLPHYGWEPVVIVPDPDKATYPVRDASLNHELPGNIEVIQTKNFDFFSLYKKASGAKNVPYAGFASESGKISFRQKISRFVRGNFFLPDPRKGWNRHAISAAIDLISSKQIDCIITTGPPHSTHLIGLQLKEKFNIPWLADFRDPWTDIYYYRDFYPTKLAHQINLGMEKKVLQRADMVITVSPSWKELFKSKTNTNIGILTNGYDHENFSNQTSAESNGLIITYIGSMTDIYPIDTFLEAFESFIRISPNAKFRIVGTISEAVKAKISRLPDKNLELVSYVDHKEVISYLYKTGVLLLLIPEHNSSKGIVPGKLFEYLAVGKPVLVIGPTDGDGAEIVRKGGSGETFTAQDAMKITNTLEKWEKKRPRIKPNEIYSRKNLTGKLAGILNKTADIHNSASESNIIH
ncbi:MAG: glycosyltransferase family 4 protein [Bacteroidales bacterium]